MTQNDDFYFIRSRK